MRGLRFDSLAEVSDALRPKVAGLLLAQQKIAVAGLAENKVCGICFCSQEQAYRFRVLVLLYKTGCIEDLRVDHILTLQESYRTPEGEQIPHICIRADFTYRRTETGTLVAEASNEQEISAQKRELLAQLGYSLIERGTGKPAANQPH